MACFLVILWLSGSKVWSRFQVLHLHSVVQGNSLSVNLHSDICLLLKMMYSLHLSVCHYFWAFENGSIWGGKRAVIPRNLMQYFCWTPQMKVESLHFSPILYKCTCTCSSKSSLFSFLFFCQENKERPALSGLVVGHAKLAVCLLSRFYQSIFAAGCAFCQLAFRRQSFLAKLMQCILLLCAYSAGRVRCWMNVIKLFFFLRTVFSESTLSLTFYHRIFMVCVLKHCLKTFSDHTD